MRAFAAVFAREIAERRMVFAVALGAGSLSIVGSFLIGWSEPGSADVRLLASTVTAAILILTFGVAFGANVIAGETAEKRLSFFYARPIPCTAIWAGKLGAALVLTIGAAVLAVLPGLVAGGGFGRSNLASSVGAGAAVAITLVGAVLVVLAAHAVVTVARLRSPWIGIDAVFAGVWATALLFCGRVLLRSDVFQEPGVFSSAPLRVLVAFVILALLAASAVQVLEGRTDARRAHGAFSATLWGILGTVLAAVAVYTWWVASATARDLTRIQSAAAAPRGTWIGTGGSVGTGRGSAAFAFDTATGRSVRTRGYWAVFSQDGTRAAWEEPRFGFFEEKKRADVQLLDLGSGRAVNTGLECDTGFTPIALSPSGRKFALPEGRALAVYDVSDLARPKQLAAFAVPEDGRAFAFVGEDTIRVFPRFMNAPRRTDLPPTALEVAELDLASKKSLVTGRLTKETLPYLRLSADGRFFLGTLRSADDAQSAPATVSILDGRTGAPIAILAEGMKNAQARLLSGNRLVVVGFADAKARALFFEGEKGWGAPARTVELGDARRLALGGEIAPGRVAVSLITFEENLPTSSRPGEYVRRTAKVAVVDAASGALSTFGDDLVPAYRLAWWIEPVLPPAEPGAPWTSLFVDAAGRLVRLDAATGAQTVVLGRK